MKVSPEEHEAIKAAAANMANGYLLTTRTRTKDKRYRMLKKGVPHTGTRQEFDAPIRALFLHSRDDARETRLTVMAWELAAAHIGVPYARVEDGPDA